MNNNNKNTKKHKFLYRWYLKDANFLKNNGMVFSCFACGGGSSLGYKLAGFDVIGCNEIDAKMMEVYKVNHNPIYTFQESIQEFKTRNDLPDELYNLDILDGSPPCSTFSMIGKREKFWGKEKKFREGQAKQILDTLFFDFIDLAQKLQPKIVIAENVKGLLLGNAKKYVLQIYKRFDYAGYYIQHFLLNAAKMGVPQSRERVFFIAVRKDLADKFLEFNDIFKFFPKLELNFNEPSIPFQEISDESDLTTKNNTKLSEYYNLVSAGQCFSSIFQNKNVYFSYYKVDPNKPVNTICATSNIFWHPTIKRPLNSKELILSSSFPLDFNFLNNNVNYVVGMSVPPVMMAQIATKIYEQWLSKIK